MFKRTLFVSLAAALLAATAQAGTVRSDATTVFRPTGKGTAEIDNSPGAARNEALGNARVPGFGIVYHGGPVMNAPTGVNVYYIWYGNWSGNTAPTILSDLASGFTGSPYFNINRTYADATKQAVVNQVNLLGAITDNYSFGTALSDANIQSVVSNAIGSGALPSDPNAVYFVLTSADVNATSGFCTQYCGWHTKASIGGTTIKYSFVGNPDRCPSACNAQTVGPNGNAGADGMASIVSHELEEAAADPELNAWYDRRGAENADKCAWTFGTEYTTANGASANMKIGGRDFLIQQNWVNAKNASTGAHGYCDVKY